MYRHTYAWTSSCPGDWEEEGTPVGAPIEAEEDTLLAVVLPMVQRVLGCIYSIRVIDIYRWRLPVKG